MGAQAPSPKPKSKYPTLSSWSYSVYTSWKKCPWQVCMEKIQRIRIKEEKSPILDKGSATHALAESYIKSSEVPDPDTWHQKSLDLLQRESPHIDLELVSRLQKGLKKDLVGRLETLRQRQASAEGELAFTRDWRLTSWFGSSTWLRVKADVIDASQPDTISIVDWKTGKVHSEHKDQRSLYALAGLLLVKLGELLPGSKHEDVKVVGEHVYTDTGETATETFTMAQLPVLQNGWLTRIEPMMTDTEFRPNPGFACKWCKFNQKNGGPCEFGV